MEFYNDTGFFGGFSLFDVAAWLLPWVIETWLYEG